MACTKKRLTGQCSHYPCPFTEYFYETDKCVDVRWDGVTGYCEHGQSCLTVCPHSWQPGTEKAVKAALLEKRLEAENLVLAG